MTLIDAVARFTEPPGNLIYHIVLAMTLAVVYSLAQIFRRNLYGRTASRWLYLGGGLLILRLILLAVDGMDWLEIFNGERLVPAIDRFASLTGLLAFVWAIQLPTSKTSTWILGAGSVFSLVIILLAPFILRNQIDPAAFNHSVIDAIWTFASLLITVLSSIYLVTSKPKGWENSLAPFAILAIGVLLHISLGRTTASVPGFVHMAEIAAYPLLALVSAKQMATLQVGEVEEPVTTPEVVPPLQEIAYLEVATDLATSPFSTNWEEFTQQAVGILGRGLKIEHIVLCTRAETPTQIEISAGYILAKNYSLNPTSLQSGEAPQLSHALTNGERVQIEENANKSELALLADLLQMTSEMPLYHFPVKVGRNVLGGLVCSAPFSVEPFILPNQERLAELISILAYRIGEWLHTEYGPEDSTLEPYTQAENERLRLLEDENRELRTTLDSMQKSSVKHGDVEALLTMHEKDQTKIQHLEAEVVRLNSQPPKKTDANLAKEIEDLRNERQLALHELANLRNSLAVMERIVQEQKLKKEEPAPKKAEIDQFAEEFRRPMASILGYTEILLGETVGLLGNAQRKFLERVQKASEDLMTVLNNLLSSGPTEQLVFSIPKKPAYLLECLEGAMHLVRDLVRERGIVLRMELPDDDAPLVGDEDGIIQILFHILSDSIERSEKGQEITILSQEKHGNGRTFLVFAVSSLPSPFPEAFEEPPLEEEDWGKFGRGMESAQRMVGILGGRLWVDQESNTYTVLLPLADVAVPA